MNIDELLKDFEDSIKKADVAVQKATKSSDKSEILKSLTGHLIASKGIYISNELARINKLPQHQHEEAILKLIDDIFQNSTMGTNFAPTNFMELYLTKESFLREIREFNITYNHDGNNALSASLSNLISSSQNKDNEVDCLTAKIISSVERQRQLSHYARYYEDFGFIKFAPNTEPVFFQDDESKFIYYEMLNNLQNGRVKESAKPSIKTILQGEEIKLCDYSTPSIYEYPKETIEYFEHSFIVPEDIEFRETKEPCVEHIMLKNNYINKEYLKWPISQMEKDSKFRAFLKSQNESL